MGVLHDALMRTVQEETQPAKVLERVLSRKFARRKLKPSSDEIALLAQRLADHIAANDERPFIFNIDDGKTTLKVRPLSLTAEDIEHVTARMAQGVERTVLPMAKGLAIKMLAEMRQDGFSALNAQRVHFASFEVRLQRHWKRGLVGLELFLAVAEEAGGGANVELRATELKTKPHLVDALTRLHARACQVTAEIHTLLNAGYADGAYARWRTLQEIEVVTALLSKHGEELAQRYLLHLKWDALRAAEEFNSHAHAMGERKFTSRQLARMMADVELLSKKFGADFAKPNGWAASILSNPKRITFRDLENAADMAHIIPSYRHASLNVHADPRAFNRPLGLIGEVDILMSGASNAGLEYAGTRAAASLLNITLCLIHVNVTLDTLVYGNALLTLLRRLNSGFADAAVRLEEKVKRLRATRVADRSNR